MSSGLSALVGVDLTISLAVSTLTLPGLAFVDSSPQNPLFYLAKWDGNDRSRTSRRVVQPLASRAVLRHVPSSPLIASREELFEDQEVRHQEQGYEHGRDVPSRAELRCDINVSKCVREVDRADNVEEPDQS